MEAAVTSPSATAPRKRKRGGGGWKSNTVTYPDAEPNQSVTASPPPSTAKEDTSQFSYEEQESIIGDYDISKFCEEWCKWPRMGLPIYGARLIPMKCPLPDHFDDFIPDEHNFTVAMALRYYRSKGVQIGMIVALIHCQAKSYLTACSEVSSNWSSSEDVKPLGITLCTLRLCEKQAVQTRQTQTAFQLIPSEAEINTFCLLISNFLSKNSDNFVAIHCCSGFNFTGFMIACYLIEVCNFSVDAAIDSFFTSRAPGIYTSSWLQALLVRYDELSFSEALAPSKRLLKATRPLWDSPLPQNLLTQGINFAELGEVALISDSVEIQRLQSVFAPLSAELGVDPFCAINPKQIDDTSDLMELSNIEAVTWRTTSPLVFFLLDHQGCYFIYKNQFFSLPQRIRFFNRKDSKKLIANTLLLGEYVVDVSDEGRVRTPRFLITDLIAFSGQPQLRLYNITNRLECARYEIVDPARSSTVPLRLRVKSLSKPSQIASILTNIIPSLPHSSDGFIFVTPAAFRRSRSTSPNDPRFLEWAESISSINQNRLLSRIGSFFQ